MPSLDQVHFVRSMNIEFQRAVQLYGTDMIELSFERNEAVITNSRGKIKYKVKFKETSHGPSAATGSGQDTRVVGEATS